MCGLYGIYLFDNSDNLDAEVYKSSLYLGASLAHRGPDGNNSQTYGNKFLFGHNRLAINDLSESGVQPFESEKSIFTFNGEMFNFKKIKRSLAESSNKFKSQNDGEVIQKILDNFSFEGLNLINGMFAISYFIKNEKKLFLIRDRFGIKPLYYLMLPNMLIYASEIHPLFKFLQKKELQNEYIKTFLDSSATDFDENTFFKFIKQVKPGHYLKINDSEIEQVEWYNLNLIRKRKVVNKQIEFENILTDAIEMRLESDVRPALSLSGGIDSSVIYTLIKERIKIPIDLFTFENSNSEFSELYQIKPLINKYSDSINVIEPDSNCVNYENIKNYLKYLDMPSWSFAFLGYFEYYKKISEKKFKVIIEGHGADELFFGYEKQILDLNALNLKQFKLLSFLRNLKNLSNMKDNINFLNKMYKILSDIFLSLQKVNGNRSIGNIMSKAIYENPLPIILRTFDRASMRFGVEIRSPYLDYRVVEYSKNFSQSDLLKKGSKSVLRDILYKYGNEIILNKYEKKGFTLDYNKIFSDQNFITHVGKLLDDSYLAKSNLLMYNNAIKILHKKNLEEWECFDVGKLILIAMIEKLFK